MKEGDNMKGRVVFLSVVLLALVCGVALGSNMGFKLNFGLLKSVNALFKPSGYDAQGMWVGSGSGVTFLLSEQPIPGEVSLELRTPAGTISFPYTDAVGSQPLDSKKPARSPSPDPGVKFGGTNFSVTHPITFLSADGVAEISILSKWEGGPAVRFAGTGLRMKDPAGALEVSLKPGSLEIVAGGNSWTFTTDSGSWRITSSVP
jgi:hypothetical protein